MGFLDNAKEKAAQIGEKISDAVHSDKVEEISDKVLDKGAQVARKVLGEEKGEKIGEIRNKIDDKLGNDGPNEPTN